MIMMIGVWMNTVTKTKNKRGRPSTGFNKTDYQREYMRRRRAKAKADKNGESDAGHKTQERED